MNHRVPLRSLIATVLVAVFAAVVFLVLNSAFGGPSPISTGHEMTLTANIEDTQGLLPKSLVTVGGVRVGTVKSISVHGDTARVVLAINPSVTPVYQDATVQVGHRTLFGEAYVALTPGHQRTGELASGATLPGSAVLPTVDLDQALETFNSTTRRHISSLSATGAAVAADPLDAPRFNATLGSLADTLTGLRSIVRQLGGQEPEIAGAIDNTTSVLGELTLRDQELTNLVADGRITNEAATFSPTTFVNGLHQFARLLVSSRRSLAAIHPLLRTAIPVLTTAARTSPEITAALRALPPVSREAQEVVEALPAARAAAVPTLHQLQRTVPALNKMISPFSLALRDLVPIFEYLSPRALSVATFFGDLDAFRKLRPNGTATPVTIADAIGHTPFTSLSQAAGTYGWVRFFVDANTGAVAGTGGTVGKNPYPSVGDPYGTFSGDYTRLTPLKPVKP